MKKTMNLVLGLLVVAMVLAGCYKKGSDVSAPLGKGITTEEEDGILDNVGGYFHNIGYVMANRGTITIIDAVQEPDWKKTGALHYIAGSIEVDTQKKEDINGKTYHYTVYFEAGYQKPRNEGLWQKLPMFNVFGGFEPNENIPKQNLIKAKLLERMKITRADANK